MCKKLMFVIFMAINVSMTASQDVKKREQAILSNIIEFEVPTTKSLDLTIKELTAGRQKMILQLSCLGVKFQTPQEAEIKLLSNLNIADKDDLSETLTRVGVAMSNVVAQGSILDDISEGNKHSCCCCCSWTTAPSDSQLLMRLSGSITELQKMALQELQKRGLSVENGTIKR